MSYVIMLPKYTKKIVIKISNRLHKTLTDIINKCAQGNSYKFSLNFKREKVMLK